MKIKDSSRPDMVVLALQRYIGKLTLPDRLAGKSFAELSWKRPSGGPFQHLSVCGNAALNT